MTFDPMIDFAQGEHHGTYKDWCVDNDFVQGLCDWINEKVVKSDNLFLDQLRQTMMKQPIELDCEHRQKEKRKITLALDTLIAKRTSEINHEVGLKAHTTICLEKLLSVEQPEQDPCRNDSMPHDSTAVHQANPRLRRGKHDLFVHCDGLSSLSKL